MSRPFRLPHGPPLVGGELVGRRNRFVVEALFEGRCVDAHLANTGRLRELLVPGARVLLAPAAAGHRKTAFDLALVRHAGRWVHVDSRLANRFTAAAIASDALEPFRGHRVVRREPAAGSGRLDFLLSDDVWLEVKSVNLVREGTAMFPDAPTERGRRHLEELAALAREGRRAHACFLVQRDDAERFRPNEAMDPAFAEALRGAARSGVGVHAWCLGIDARATRLLGPLPVKLG